MSIESLKDLNTNVLIGYTEKRGHAWHYRADLQGEEPNHYPGPIPSHDVDRRLFGWKAVARSVFVGESADSAQLQPAYKAIVHGDTGHVFRIGGDSYEIHQYREWLLSNVTLILDNNDVGIASAGLLRHGGIAWVMIETPESLRSASGMELRPQLLATTSHNGTLASTFKMVQTIVVCDNTLNMALSEGSTPFRVRHTAYSTLKLEEARRALDLIIASGESALEFLDRLAEVSVSEGEWEQIKHKITPIPADPLPRVMARYMNTHAAYDRLYHFDERCTPWKGTALGVFQAFNTYQLHVAGTNTNRFDRNMVRVMGTSGEAKDRQIVRAIETVCQTKFN